MGVTRELEKIPPLRLSSTVVRGFGRGSSQLGFPTANLAIRWDKRDDPSSLGDAEQCILKFATTAKTGIYAAFARVVDGPDASVYKVAMSVGWNPTFQGDDALKEKTIECWLLGYENEDFYDFTLQVIVLAYVRDEAKFNSLDDLITEIRDDGNFCSNAIDTNTDLSALQHDPFFRSSQRDAPQ